MDHLTRFRVSHRFEILVVLAVNDSDLLVPLPRRAVQIITDQLLDLDFPFAAERGAERGIRFVP
jgi:hypothetical protein